MYACLSHACVCRLREVKNADVMVCETVCRYVHLDRQTLEYSAMVAFPHEGNHYLHMCVCLWFIQLYVNVYTHTPTHTYIHTYVLT